MKNRNNVFPFRSGEAPSGQEDAALRSLPQIKRQDRVLGMPLADRFCGQWAMSATPHPNCGTFHHPLLMILMHSVAKLIQRVVSNCR